MRAPSTGGLTPIALAAMEVLHEGPKHPYEIQQTMREREVWRLMKLTPGSLYHAIDRLARDGLIQTVETTREGRRPERTVYRLTDSGRDVFAERLRLIIAEPAVEYPQFAVAVAMLHELDRNDALVQLGRRTMTLEAQLAADRVTSEHLTKRGVHPMYWTDVDFRLRMREAELAWIEDLVERLTGGQITWPEPCAGFDGTARTRPKLTIINDEEEGVG
jgi:DNA-binding PadR family transcriptional regulator